MLIKKGSHYVLRISHNIRVKITSIKGNLIYYIFCNSKQKSKDSIEEFERMFELDVYTPTKKQLKQLAEVKS